MIFTDYMIRIDGEESDFKHIPGPVSIAEAVQRFADHHINVTKGVGAGEDAIDEWNRGIRLRILRRESRRDEPLWSVRETSTWRVTSKRVLTAERLPEPQAPKFKVGDVVRTRITVNGQRACGIVTRSDSGEVDVALFGPITTEPRLITYEASPGAFTDAAHPYVGDCIEHVESGGGSR